MDLECALHKKYIKFLWPWFRCSLISNRMRRCMGALGVNGGDWSLLLLSKDVTLEARSLYNLKRCTVCVMQVIFQ